ncbi:MAG: HPr family phosphocarrier protein [Candidatus Dormibacteraeota bacterium]|nr:HPr family phosphocarrier protein [Candidatus Dormibacteraeota bacterium]MDQ6921875.1 HPr family phosphocarrier protein [Candidatus Dormibacteraeota bacterium]
MSNESEASEELTVDNEHGLHLRPAADFVRLAARYRSRVTVANLTRGGGRQANARSLLEITSLGIDRGHLIRLTAAGEDAGEAVKALSELIRSNFGA